MEPGPFPGPFCAELKLTSTNIANGIVTSKCGTVLNGLVLELRSFFRNDTVKLINYLRELCTDFHNADYKQIQKKISRLVAKKAKFTSRKKVQGYEDAQAFLTEQFRMPGENSQPRRVIDLSMLETTGLSSTLKDSNGESDFLMYESRDCETAHANDKEEHRSDRCSPKKRDNELTFQIEKKEKHIRKLAEVLKRSEENLDRRKKLLGHYSIKNVNKRDETAKKNHQMLKETQRKVLKERKQHDSVIAKKKELEKLVTELRQENEDLTDKISRSEKQVLKLETEITKKIAAQKSSSHWRMKALKLQQLTSSSNQDVQHVQQDETETDSTFEENLSLQLKTKNEDGTYHDNVRLCVIELASLEVAIEKISYAISTVAKHLLQYEIPLKDLPNKSTTQTIVDEGHFLAKTYIAEKIDQSENWGLNRDGTSRKKKKLLDTSVTLSDGQIISLGFSRVAHESAAAINEVTKEHLVELSRMQSVNDDTKGEQQLHDKNYVCRTLQKLAYTMSDRAGNEKLATKMLVEWREQLLRDSLGDEEIKTVHSFHCMAHVLLGFHSYAAKDLKGHEAQLAEDHGPLGRDALPIFRFWKRTGTVVERVVRVASDVFGPVGDYLGLRDRWEAHCKAEGIKSIIGNYKDNRFNALFETAAEVYVHQEEFQKVINSVEKPNMKIQSLKADLQHPIVRVLLQSLGLIYLKVTGPFWNMVTCGNIPYLQLYPHIQKLLEFLQLCTTDPATILNMDGHWTVDNDNDFYEIPHRNRLMPLFHVADEHRDILLNSVSVVVRSMTKTIQKQLSDFLGDGKYANEPLAADLQRTNFAHVNNLGCEHHFGDLDSSQRRRPNSSLHHHSSIQLLKRNRSGLMEWMKNMDDVEKTKIMKAARKEGKALRNMHIQREKDVLHEIQTEMQNIKQPKKRRRKNNRAEANDQQTTEDNFEVERFEAADQLKRALPVNRSFKENSYVAVAYQDNWYPGIVLEKKNDDCAKIKFLVHTQKKGVFKWPARDDVQEVSSDFVIKCDISVECVSSGRQWSIQEYSNIQSVYEMFCLAHF